MCGLHSSRQPLAITRVQRLEPQPLFRFRVADAAVQYLKKYNKDAAELNEIAITFFEQIEDKKMLKKAIAWSKKAVKLDRKSGVNYLTLANLYNKINKKSNALKAVETAIYVGKINGEETTEAEKLLQLLKEGEKAENKK